MDYDVLQPDSYARILELEGFGKEKPDLSIKIKPQPPKWLEHFQDLDLMEGQSAHCNSNFIDNHYEQQ